VIIFPQSERETCIHRLDPRVRAATGFLFAVVVCLSQSPPVLAASFATALALLALARPDRGRTVRGLAALNLFMLLLAVFLPPFVAGEAAWRIGSVAWSREGLWRAGTIAIRANSILLALMALLGAMEPAHLGLALCRLGCPEKLAHILLFMIRYVEVIHREYHRLRDAMRMRGFRAACDRRTCQAYGYLVGLLLVRSLDRSDRIVEAMKCRGFRGHFHLLIPLRIRAWDLLFATLAAADVAWLSWMEWR